MEEYLAPTATIDSDHPRIVALAQELCSPSATPVERARGMFLHVRDAVPYSLYMISVFREDFTASRVLAWGKGYCVQKAVLLAALGRASGIPARLAFASIRNHKVPEALMRQRGSNVFPRHGYTQFHLDGRWVSVAATFDRGLCARLGVPVVEWTGEGDAVLPPCDLKGAPYIEYVEKFGAYADLPFEWIVRETSKYLGPDKRPWLSRKDAPGGG